MKKLDAPISKDELLRCYCTCFKDMSKAVVDIQEQLIVVDAELHADQEAFLLSEGSKLENLWGINLYPEKSDFVEYTSLINIRPSMGNPGMDVQDQAVRDKVERTVQKWILP